MALGQKKHKQINDFYKRNTVEIKAGGKTYKVAKPDEELFRKKLAAKKAKA